MIDILLTAFFFESANIPQSSFELPTLPKVSFAPIASQTNISFSAKAVYGVELHTGTPLYTKNEHEKLPVASLTKLATALALIGKDPHLTAIMPVSQRSTRIPGSKLFLIPGTNISSKQALEGLLIRSGNDVSMTISEYYGGESFIHFINSTVSKLNLHNTSFKNSHGLDQKEHVSSAYDITHIMRKLYTFPHARKALSQQYIEYNGNIYENTNLMLSHAQVIGGKTGTTDEAQECLSILFSVGSQKYIFTFLGSKNRYADAKTALEYLSNNF